MNQVRSHSMLKIRSPSPGLVQSPVSKTKTASPKLWAGTHLWVRKKQAHDSSSSKSSAPSFSSRDLSQQSQGETMESGVTSEW